ncbi:MAG: SlyX [Pseudomonadota bacterium]|jgi:uncharacterized coiled-coil protein SlyX
MTIPLDPFLEERLQQIEMKVAYQEVGGTDASRALYELERRVSKAETQLKALSAHLKALGIHGDDSADQKPPHY